MKCDTVPYISWYIPYQKSGAIAHHASHFMLS